MKMGEKLNNRIGNDTGQGPGPSESSTASLRTGEKKEERCVAELWSIRYGGETYQIHMAFKQVRSIRLRVVPGGKVHLSAPLWTDREWLTQFLIQHADWVAENVEKMRSIETRQPEKRPPLTQEERQEALDYLMPMVDKWYPAVECRGVAYPHVTIRAMTTRFGTCSVNRGRITLNSVLLKVPRECAEYVVLHELTHFLYPNHSSQFYAYIEGYMPDWKEREVRLKRSV